MIRSLLHALTSLLPPPRVIYDRNHVEPYLYRWYLRGAPYMRDGSSPFNDSGAPKLQAVFPPGWGLYLHRFYKSDDDAALHSHPWLWAYSLILAGGYREERKEDVREVRPGRLVRLGQDDFHRVDLLEHDSWSLFLAGPKVTGWGFWKRETGEYLPWREFIASIRGPGWDDPQARTWTAEGHTVLAKTAFAASQFLKVKLGRDDVRVVEAPPWHEFVASIRDQRDDAQAVET